MNVVTPSTQPLITVEASASPSAAFELMRDHRVRHLPVMENGSVVGIISDRDLQRGRKVEAQNMGESTLAPGLVVRDFMSGPLATLPEGAPLSEATRIMIDQKISAILVTRGGNINGIITLDDLLRVLQTLLTSGAGVTSTIDEPNASNLTRKMTEWVHSTPLSQVLAELSNSGI